MGWFGSADLATKYAIILFSLLGGVLAAGFIKVCINKRRLRKHEKRLASVAAVKHAFRDTDNLKPPEEGDLFGVRALESGFFGGVAQSQPSSRATSPTETGPSSHRQEYRAYTPPSIHLSPRSRPRSPLSPKTRSLVRPGLQQWPSSTNLPKSPLSRTSIANNEHPHIPSTRRPRGKSNLVAEFQMDDLPKPPTGLGIFYDEPINGQNPFADPGSHTPIPENLPSKPQPAWPRMSSTHHSRPYDTSPSGQNPYNSYHAYHRSRSGERSIFGGSRDSSWDRNETRGSFDSWRVANTSNPAPSSRRSFENTIDGLNTSQNTSPPKPSRDTKLTTFSESSRYSRSPSPTLPIQPTSPLPSTSARISDPGALNNDWFEAEKTPPNEPTTWTGGVAGKPPTSNPFQDPSNAFNNSTNPFRDPHYKLHRPDSTDSEDSIGGEDSFHVELNKTKHKRVSTRVIESGPGLGEGLAAEKGSVSVSEHREAMQQEGLQSQRVSPGNGSESSGSPGPILQSGLPRHTEPATTTVKSNGKDVRVRVPSKLYEGPVSQESALVEPLTFRSGHVDETSTGIGWAVSRDVERGEPSELAAKEADRSPEVMTQRRDFRDG